MVASTLGSGPRGSPPSPARRPVTSPRRPSAPGEGAGAAGRGSCSSEVPGAGLHAKVRDDLREVDRRADAGLGRTDERDGVDGAVSGEARGHRGVAVGRHREADVHVERRVALDQDVPSRSRGGPTPARGRWRSTTWRGSAAGAGHRARPSPRIVVRPSGPPRSSPPRSSVRCRHAATSAVPSTSSRGIESASARRRRDAPNDSTPCWANRRGSNAAGSAPKPMSPNSSSGESRDERSADSSMVRQSSRRSREVRTSGSASLMKPGLLPVLWIDVLPGGTPPRSAPRTAGSMLAGRWNSPRVVTTLVPAAEHGTGRRRHSPGACRARSRPGGRGSPRRRGSQ